MNHLTTVTVFLLIFGMLRSGPENFANCKISHSTTTNNMREVQQLANILNPDEHPDYPDWKGREWRRWFLKERKRAANVHHHYNDILRMRHTEPVIVLRPDDLMAAFRGHLLQYGTKNQAMVWSSVSFPTFVLQKAGPRIRAFNCGEMFIAGRLRNGIPVYLHDFYPAPIRNPLGGHIRYPVSKYCAHVPPI